LLDVFTDQHQLKGLKVLTVQLPIEAITERCESCGHYTGVNMPLLKVEANGNIKVTVALDKSALVSYK
jgi:hypothetical protein